MDEAELKQEFEIVRKARRLIEEILAEFGPFVSLAEASRQTGVSLQTLAEAVRTERVPALKVLGKSWVRVSAVRAYYKREENDDTDLRLQRALYEDGLLEEIRPRSLSKFTPFKPVKISGKPLSETIIEERR
jgi:lambda repressor-like predicted transcriptional regulator